MTGKGLISVAPNRRLQLMLAAHAVWFATLCGLGLWWERLVSRQASRIAELEAKLGLATTASAGHSARFGRMMFWESATFFLLLLAATALLVWLTWREARRARALQAFFASVTHELRTPLTSIRLQAESLVDASGIPDEASARLVARLLEDTSRLEAQVERTLELARVEGGGPVLSQPLVLKPWLDYFLVNWGHGHASRLYVKADDVPSCEIQADPGAVQVILKNLLENTIRHGGGRDRVPTVTFSTERSGDWVVLRYRDDGPGFRGDARRLGRLFQKGEGSTGAGVGLYLVSVLMRRMGGRAEFAAAAPGLETALWFRAGGGANA